MISPENPFAAPSELPYALPPFDRIVVEHYRPAFEEGLSRHSAEIEEIAGNTEDPTFENTVVALERAGDLLDRAGGTFFNIVGSNATDEIQDIQAELAPRLAAHADAIHLNPRLFGRISALYERRESLGLDAESLRLLERRHTDFSRAGAGLPEADQEKLRKLNGELSTLQTRFQQNLLRDTNDLAVVIDDAAELAGLDAGTIATAAETASDRGEEGKYVLSLTLPTAQAALESLENRAVRERIFTASVSRGNRGNEQDNNAVVAEIVRLRAERAALLGYPNHAAYVISDETAKTAEAAAGLLERLAPVAVANARTEAAELQRHLEADVPGATLQPWDWAFYAEKVRRERFQVDTAALRPYFELNRVLHDGVFFAASQLYGLSFTERHDLPKYHPEVRIFEVFDTDGSGLGLFLMDYYTRESKRGGAWMNNFVDQSGLLGGKTVVVNVLNVSRPPAGEPTLLTFDEVTTAFHEFGHALHSLLSGVEFPTFSGTNVPRDFVEYPSQVNEMWMLWPEVLANYAKHHETGSPSRPSRSRSWRPPRSTARASRPPSTWPRRCSTWPGTVSAWTTAWTTSSASRRTRWRRRASRWKACRRGTGPRTSTTSSAAATAPGTTPTSGARCSTPTPCSGSPRTAASSARTATTSAAPSWAAAAAWTRWRRSARSAAASRRSSRCSSGGGSTKPE